MTELTTSTRWSSSDAVPMLTRRRRRAMARAPPPQTIQDPAIFIFNDLIFTQSRHALPPHRLNPNPRLCRWATCWCDAFLPPSRDTTQPQCNNKNFTRDPTSPSSSAPCANYTVSTSKVLRRFLEACFTIASLLSHADVACFPWLIPWTN